MIPSFEEFLFPVLFVLMDGKPQQRDDLRESCVKYMGFSEEELGERISSGKKYKIVDRLQWATYYLQKAGLVFRPDHATDQITAEGKALIESGVTKIDRQFLRENFEAYRVFEKQTRDAAKLRLQEKKEKQKKEQNAQSRKKPKDSKKRNEIVNTEHDLFEIDNSSADKTALDFKPSMLESTINKISEDCEQLNKELISELKGIINDFDKESLFKLLLDLLPKMGYSTNFVERKISAKMSHDIRFSGFVNIDELGLNRFFVIVNNNTKDEIDLVDVQSFVGVLSSNGISTGVYITTSEFSSDALSYQTHGAVRCILIGGEMLAKLMIKFNVGVVTRNVFEIKDVDQEYLFTRLTQS